MTLLEPEMLMMAVQSGNSDFLQILFAMGFFSKVAYICTRIGWKWEEDRWG